jgi:hypothetical protein
MIDWSRKETPATRVAQGRASLSVPRHRFAISAMQAGLITATEAEDWAAGTGLPALVASEIAKLPAGQARAAARIEAKAAATINRMHPLILGLAATLKLADEQVDALFVST